MPEDVTVEDIEQLHIDGKLGVKAIAIYATTAGAQPLSTQKRPVAVPGEEPAAVVERSSARDRAGAGASKLPPRSSKTFCSGSRSRVRNGRAVRGQASGELFLKVAKQGSTLAGIMDAFAISVSHGLQYGVPLRAFVDMFTNMRFEPAGMTDDPEIRFATSLVDYIFRRLAVEYMAPEKREAMGILTVGERLQLLGTRW